MSSYRFAVMISFLISLAFAPVDARAAADDVPADRVAVMYFHRTERCPTCRRMGTYTQETVKSEFKDAVESGEVTLYFVDFQDAKNAKIKNAYDIEGPALVVAKVADHKVTKWQSLSRIWELASDKPKFTAYVRDSIRSMMKD